MTDGIQYQGLFVPKQSTEPSKGQYMVFFKKNNYWMKTECEIKHLELWQLEGYLH